MLADNSTGQHRFRPAPGLRRPVTGSIVRDMVTLDSAAQLDQAVSVVRDVVADDLIGVYAFGSMIEGGLRPASDLDLLAVVRQSLSSERRTQLARRIMTVSGRRAGGRSVELTAVVRSGVNPWHYPAVADFRYGEWLVEEIREQGVAGPAVDPNLAIELTQALRSDRSLYGPPVAEVLAAVPAVDVARACRDTVPGLLDDLEGDERNVLLTFARIWCTLATGEIRCKDEAADWALPRLPERFRPVLRHARHLYRTTQYADETWPIGLREQVGDVSAHILAQAGIGAAPTR